MFLHKQHKHFVGVISTLWLLLPYACCLLLLVLVHVACTCMTVLSCLCCSSYPLHTTLCLSGTWWQSVCHLSAPSEWVASRRLHTPSFWPGGTAPLRRCLREDVTTYNCFVDALGQHHNHPACQPRLLRQRRKLLDCVCCQQQRGRHVEPHSLWRCQWSQLQRCFLRCVSGGCCSAQGGKRKV